MLQITLIGIVVLINACSAKSDGPAITAFSIEGSTGVITGNQIAVTMPSGTDVRSLTATYITKGIVVFVGRTNQKSGETKNDFTSPVTYSVLWRDGYTTSYVVTVTVASIVDKAITSFSVDGVAGVITGTDIVVTMPFATNTSNLIPAFTTTGIQVTVDQAVHQSGLTEVNFIGSKVYTVTAADGTTHDYNVTVAASTTPPALQFATQAGAGGAIVRGYATTRDSSGNRYITGITTVALFGQVQTGGIDYYIAKYDSSNTLVLYKQFGSVGGNTYPFGIGLDGSGNIYVTGNVSGVGLYGLRVGTFDYFIAKYNSSGTLLWGKEVGAVVGDNQPNGLVVDSDGNSYIAGFARTNLSGETHIGVSGTNYNAFIAKFDTSGALIWTRLVGGVGATSDARAISLDSTGNVLVTGYTLVAISGTGLSGFTQTGTTDYFILKYDSDGTFLWGKQVGALGGNSLGYGIALDNRGNSYTTGNTTVGLSGENLIGIRDYFIAKYNSAGTLQWSRQGGAVAANFIGGYAINVSKSGNSYIAGITNGALTGQTLHGVQDYFIAVYDNAGTLFWTTQVGTATGTTQGFGIDVDDAGHFNITGLTTKGISNQIQLGTQDYILAEYY